MSRIIEILQNADLFNWFSILGFLVLPFTVINLYFNLWPRFTSWKENRRKNRLDKLLCYELPQLEKAHKFLNLPINAALAQFAHELFWTLVLLSFWFIVLYLITTEYISGHLLAINLDIWLAGVDPPSIPLKAVAVERSLFLLSTLAIAANFLLVLKVRISKYGYIVHFEAKLSRLVERVKSEFPDSSIEKDSPQILNLSRLVASVNDSDPDVELENLTDAPKAATVSASEST